MYTISQLSKLAGVTPRTLRYYDQIGLLKPSLMGDGNGYRYYDENAVLRLQQILLYRELDIPLDDIKRIISRSDFDVLQALESHKLELGRRLARIQRLITTVDETILHLKGQKEMSSKQIFLGFTPEEEEKYAKEAEQLYDPETVRASNKRWQGYSQEQKQAILAESKQIYLDMIAAMPKGANSPEAQACVARWRKNMNYFWTPRLDQLLPLASHYVDDPRFKANFDQIHPDLAVFMREAVEIYVRNQAE